MPTASGHPAGSVTISHPRGTATHTCLPYLTLSIFQFQLPRRCTVSRLALPQPCRGGAVPYGRLLPPRSLFSTPSCNESTIKKYSFILILAAPPGGGSGRPFPFEIQQWLPSFGPDPGGNAILIFMLTLSAAGVERLTAGSRRCGSDWYRRGMAPLEHGGHRPAVRFVLGPDRSRSG